MFAKICTFRADSRASDPHRSRLGDRAAECSRDALAQECFYIRNILGAHLPPNYNWNMFFYWIIYSQNVMWALGGSAAEPRAIVRVAHRNQSKMQIFASTEIKDFVIFLFLFIVLNVRSVDHSHSTFINSFYKFV